MTFTPMEIKILEGININKTFIDINRTNIEILKNINITIYQNELIAIIGPSGSGKSTLLHILGGLEQPTSGNIKICDKNILKFNEKEKCIFRNQYLGFVYQFHHLLQEFSALENVCIPLLLRKIKIKTAEKIATNFLKKVGLSNRLFHKPSELSGGEKQRVAVARAFVTQPKCVLADEPTGNLDHKTAEKIYDLILDLNREFQTTFVVVSHDISIINFINKTFILENGKLLKKS